jgi:spore coat polysaccharide biosynthesis protein SpsF (cytidylyltransferase family)
MNAIIIQVRMGSTRLPEKVLKPFFGTKTILEIVIESAQKNKFGWETIVATTSHKNDDPIYFLCKKLNVKCFRGNENDVLKRFIDAANLFNIKNIIRVCADNPFLDIDLLNELIAAANTNADSEYISHFTPEGVPSIKTHWGIFAEFTTYNALLRANQLTHEPFYHEHVTNFIYGNPQLFNISKIQMPHWASSEVGMRFTVDTPDDFSIMTDLYKKFYPTFNIEKIVSYVKTQPVILAAMDKNINQFKK